MHSAPSVSYPVGRCAFQRVTWTVLSAVALAMWVTWAMFQPLNWLMGVSAMAAVLGVALGWRSLQTQSGTLTWDGDVWCWHGRVQGAEDALGEIFVALDVQKALVLRWQPTSGKLITGGRYLWLGQENAAHRWLNLRCAVYGRVTQR